MQKLIVTIALLSLVLVSGCDTKEYSSEGVCNAYKKTGENSITTYVHYTEIYTPFFEKYPYLHGGHGWTVDGGSWTSKEEYECFLRMHDVCDENNICQEYSIRFFINHNDFVEWCNDECVFGG